MKDANIMIVNHHLSAQFFHRGLCIAAMLSVFMCVFFMCLPRALAAEIILTNGDRMTGIIQRSKDDALILKSPDAKENIRLKWSSIKGFTTQQPVTVEMRDRTRITGVVIYEDGVGMRIEQADGNVIVIEDPKTIKTINVPEIEYNAMVKAGGSYNDGDSQKAGVTAAAEFAAETYRQRFSIYGRYEYGEDSGEMSARNASGIAEYRYYPIPKIFYLYTSAKLENDTFQDIELRTTLTAGLGYQFFDTDRFKLSAGCGPSYLNTQYSPPTPDISAAAASWQLDFELWPVLEKIKLYHNQNGSFPFEDTSQVNAIFLQGIEFRIIDNFGVSLDYRVDFNNAPAAGKERINQSLSFNLTYDFDF
jgi:putative salt-induced outer membrane protein YdiY